MTIQLGKHLQPRESEVVASGKYAVNKGEERSKPLLSVDYVFVVIFFLRQVDDWQGYVEKS